MVKLKNQIIARFGAAALLVVVAQSSVLAQTPSGSPLYGCVQSGVKESERKFRIVGPTVACKKNEVRVQWNIVGQAGQTGAAGPAGPAGPQGTVGAIGASGPAGAAGPQGPNGAAGSIGIAGPDGVAGARGPSGPTGASGADGAQGLAGPAGPVGAAGTQAGDVGPAGPAGATGAAGPTGAQGPTGPQGAMVIGARGVAGPQGPAGPAGPAGQLAPSGAITGTLTCNAPTLAPAGSLVYVPGRAFTARTGSDGSFQIDHLPAGSYSVKASVSGQTTVTRSGITVAAAAVPLGSIEACTTGSPVVTCFGVTCGGTKPICNTGTRRCVECLSNTNCPNPMKPICTSFICGTGGVL